MGREIRMVPPNWKHPCYAKDNAPQSNLVGEYIPMHDRDYETVANQWVDSCIRWAKGEHEDQMGENPATCKYYWEQDGNPPDRESYRPNFAVEPTWFQIYETVTEGTPVSPPFATKQELARYLSENGDFAYQHGYRDISPKPTYEQALKFIEQGFVLSMTFSPESGLRSNYDTVID